MKFIKKKKNEIKTNIGLSINSETPLTSQFVRILAGFASHEATALSWCCHPFPSQAIALRTA